MGFENLTLEFELEDLSLCIRFRNSILKSGFENLILRFRFEDVTLGLKFYMTITWYKSRVLQKLVYSTDLVNKLYQKLNNINKLY